LKSPIDEPERVDLLDVGSAPPESANLVAHRLTSFRRVLVGSPEYLKRRGMPRTPEALAKHDRLTHATADAWTLVSAEREARVRVDAVFRCTALHALRDLALRGAGIALLPDWIVEDDLARRALKRVLPEWTTEAVSVHAIHRTEHRGAPRVRALVEHLSSAYAASAIAR
jgi:DNA-binding transcriptional LysR family regulator